MKSAVSVAVRVPSRGCGGGLCDVVVLEVVVV